MNMLNMIEVEDTVESVELKMSVWFALGSLQFASRGSTRPGSEFATISWHQPIKQTMKYIDVDSHHES